MKIKIDTICYFDPVTDVCIAFQGDGFDEQNWLAGASMVVHPVSGHYNLPAALWPLGKTAKEMQPFAAQKAA